MGHLRYPILSKAIQRTGNALLRIGSAEMQGIYILLYTNLNLNLT